MSALAMGQCVQSAALLALRCCDPAEKVRLVRRMHADWQSDQLRIAEDFVAPKVEIPGRPDQPVLVAPDAVPRRNPGSVQGKAALIHAIAHIEFNAINLAVDCVVRFASAGKRFVTEWLQIALEESLHFELLDKRLAELNHAYGDFAAHNGLWEMAVKTDHDLLARMALVPRLLEARGLDATPAIQAKLKEIGDSATLAILDIILRDEVGHVAIGDYWYRAECARRNVEPEETFRQLLVDYSAPAPRPPFNESARQAAGFSAAELAHFRTRASR